MSTRQATAAHTWRSGFCGTGWHFDCRGTYGPIACSCHCHDTPAPVPAPTPATCPECGRPLPEARP